MFHFCTTRNSGIAYLFWRWIYRNNGQESAYLDRWYLATRPGMNEYDSLAATYKKSDLKPDKHYSILPTVLAIVGECPGKIIIDIGCGAGFFTVPLAELGAARVYGVDHSEAQIRLAQEVSVHPRITYVLSDVFVDPMKPVDIMVVPFVANYARTIPILRYFFQKLYDNLQAGGKAVFVIDLPNGRSLKRFGATKTFLEPRGDEASIEIKLFKEEKPICTLMSLYYRPETIECLLQKAGFKNITWHKPIISEEGLSTMGADFWKGYADDPELGYVSAEK